jgi:hypothetical protein
MSIPQAWQQTIASFALPEVVEPSQGQRTSEAGLLPTREFDQRVGLTQAFAGALDDPRDPRPQILLAPQRLARYDLR